jgi:hypothetical protein
VTGGGSVSVVNSASKWATEGCQGGRGDINLDGAEETVNLVDKPAGVAFAVQVEVANADSVRATPLTGTGPGRAARSTSSPWKRRPAATAAPSTWAGGAMNERPSMPNTEETQAAWSRSRNGVTVRSLRSTSGPRPETRERAGTQIRR